MLYKKTGNLRACQLLLGHTKLESTVRYLGVEVDDALELSEALELCRPGVNAGVDCLDEPYDVFSTTILYELRSRLLAEAGQRRSIVPLTRKFG